MLAVGWRGRSFPVRAAIAAASTPAAAAFPRGPPDRDGACAECVGRRALSPGRRRQALEHGPGRPVIVIIVIIISIIISIIIISIIIIIISSSSSIIIIIIISSSIIIIIIIINSSSGSSSSGSSGSSISIIISTGST